MNKRCYFFAGLTVFLLLFGFFIYYYFSFVPFNMDEFLHYQPIACSEYPLNRKNSFQEACFDYGLKILGTKHHLPLRSYSYTGSSQSLLYYPLFKIWPSPDSARCMGLIMLAIQAFLIRRIFGLNPWYCFLGLLSFFPYAFGHMVDTGPVSFQTTSVFLICFLAKRWRETIDAGDKGTSTYAVAIGFLIFWGIWTKLVYFALLPEIIFLMVYMLAIPQEGKKSSLRFIPLLADLGKLLLTAGIPLAVLFTGIDIYGKRYYEILGWGQSISLQQKGLWWWHFNNLLKYFTNPVQSAHRVFDIQETITLEGVSLLVLIVLFIVTGIWRLRSKGKPVSFIVLNFAFFLTAFLLMAQYQTAWAMHHVVLTFPFLLLALLGIISGLKDKRILWGFFVAFALLNGSFYYSLTQKKVIEGCHPSLHRLNDWLNKKYARDHVIVCIDWGMYYLKALYGPKDQCVLFMSYDPRNPDPGLKKVLAETHRQAIFVGMNSKMDKDYTEVNPGFDTGLWRVGY